MTKPIKATAVGLQPHWKVRVTIPGALIHLASKVEPVVTLDLEGRPLDVAAEWIEDPNYGDTLGWIDWSLVAGITWRWSS